MKKITALVLAIIMTAAFTGCAPKEEPAAIEEPQATPEPEPQEVESTIEQNPVSAFYTGYKSATEAMEALFRSRLEDDKSAEAADTLIYLADHDMRVSEGNATFGWLLSTDTADQFDFSTYDYVVDAVDTVTAKVTLVLEAQKAGVPIISCMGAGNKLDPTRFRVADIYKTSGCPLARVMRTALRKRGVKHLKVVYSDEIPTRPIEDMSISCRSHCICPPGAKHKCTERRDIPGSTAFVPSVAGLIIAGEVVKDLAKR